LELPLVIVFSSLRALAMHVVSGKCGLSSSTRATFLVLAGSAASCVSEPARAPHAEAPPSTAPAAPRTEPPVRTEVAGTEPGAVQPPAVPQTEPRAEPRAEGETEPQGERDPSAGAHPGAPAAPAAGTPAVASDRASATRPGTVHGSLSVRYRGRFTGDDQDQEARGVLALDVADPRAPWITGHLLARMDVDIDGLDESAVFEDLSDTYDGSVVTKLYLAYADVSLRARPEDSPGTLRVGRQSDARLPEVLRLDGITYTTRPAGEREIELGVYGGIPVHLYESSRDGDLAFGTFVEGRPWKGGRARLDWMHLEDELVLGEEHDDLVALGLWQELARHWRLEGEFSHLEGDPRDLRLRTFYDDPDSETIVRAGYYELLETQTLEVTELDPFYDELLEYFPYRQATLVVSRSFGSHTVVDVGLDVRRVSDSDDVGEFNRDWERYYATASLHDVPAEGVALSITGDRWDDDDRDTSAFGADLSYAAEERWNAAVGSYYSLYKYELLELDEREDVRTYYTRAAYELSKSLDLELVYEFEDDDLDTYHTLRLGALWRF
jgi:hypothetical protein